MAQVADLRGRGLLITRIGAKTDFTEVRVYWASSQSESGKVVTDSVFLFLLGTFTYFRSNFLLDIRKDTIEEKINVFRI
jgi:hypothetical protein